MADRAGVETLIKTSVCLATRSGLERRPIFFSQVASPEGVKILD